MPLRSLCSALRWPPLSPGNSTSDRPWVVFLVIVMGTLIGLAFGLLFLRHQSLAAYNASIEIVLTLVAPYCMYYFAEHFHFSGVLAVVSGGLFLSSKRQKMFTYRTRLEGVNVWTNLTFVLNGLVFLLIGLQLPSITSQLGRYQFRQCNRLWVNYFCGPYYYADPVRFRRFCLYYFHEPLYNGS